MRRFQPDVWPECSGRHHRRRDESFKDRRSTVTEHAGASFPSDDSEPSDRAMLVLQYVTAQIAGLAAALLAVLR
jgi:hypothetical protein